MMQHRWKHGRLWLAAVALGLFSIGWPGGLWTSPAVAAPVEQPHVKAELIAETTAIRPGVPFWVAIRFELEEHWHTYWRNPGDSGQPTSIKWKLPPGFKADDIQWPIPKRIEVSGLVGYGYEKEVLHLIRITPPDKLPVGKPVTLAGKVRWLVCKEECIPGDAELTLTLPVTNDVPQPSPWTEAFSRARAQLPLATSEWKLRAAQDGDHLVLLLTPPTGAEPLTEVTFFPFEELVIEGAEPQRLLRVKGGYALRLVRSKVAEKTPTQLAGVVVTPTGWRGAGTEPGLTVEAPIEPLTALGDLLTPVAGTRSDRSSSGGQPLGWLALLVTLGGAFLGGLILNLMPCVLPVLSIKVLGFVEQAKAGRGEAWQHGLVFTAGVVLSFWALAGILLALRAGGQQLGWGFQLQEPAFVAFLVAVLFVFGLVLFGVFEVGLTLTTVGGAAMNRSGLAGSFFTGVLATVVATPCTAPFMGSALGVALAQPTAVALLIFTALALGMSAPYLILAAAPQLLRFVPRPGAWMESFKQFMGFLLMGSVVWLLWVLGLEVGVDGLALMLGMLVLIGLGGWIWGRWGSLTRTPAVRRIAMATALLIIVGSTVFGVRTIHQLPSAASAATGSRETKSGGIRWEPFSPARVEELRRAGKPVFVDFTAAWCLSCKANEKVALETEAVRQEIERRGIVMVKADWTNRDEEITRTLAEFGRSGVPLYVFYPANGREPKVLPEVITPGLILETFREDS
ncbi:protein-disulfide reductase DsbD [Chloracidobacterium aggregatum]|uniref:Thioredoxin family protein n=2 Tax=Chloracidobacterium TaxID=458032 RepID=A0ABX8B887_9BACT|nr:thioredoxin family protein [Chloracidobacterium aggregatum]QUV89173.1 thioredoxin family protein [Chloracidobacterium sp. S]QUV92022.1 thioredoxin family protein [Chloracidobacterium sp. A]QUV95296.1 thioredoxin family protein [Chloracidobacterium sp. N]QUV98516.1 thioredoxin family protein [Chloracidobacterium sp. E]